MSFFNVNKEDVESFTLVTNPGKYYRSSSIASADVPNGVTGSIYLSARRMSSVKDIRDVNVITSSRFADDSVESYWHTMQRVTGSNITPFVQAYMDAVRAQSTSEAETKQAHITRFRPGVDISENFLRKRYLKEVLNKHYRTKYPTSHWAYTNYNCLNFFTSSKNPENAVLLYPDDTIGLGGGVLSGSYMLSGAFSLCCRIKPNQKGGIDTEYKAGTIYHMSSCYALSLITGSLRDGDGRPDAFRLMLQLSHSADITPETAVNGTYPNDLVFLSTDNSIKFGDWHDVVVRWGTNAVNDGTGSFMINGIEHGTFVVPSSSIAPPEFEVNPSVLSVGNYYEGQNTGSSAQSFFFARNTAKRHGLLELNSSTAQDEPVSYSFNHPLNAEIHELKIATKYYSDSEVVSSSSIGLGIIPEEVVFYVPPFFTKESPVRRFAGTKGGVLVTPFYEMDGTSSDPFNVALAFNTDGHDINVENFVRDFAQSRYPLLFNMTSSLMSSTTEVKTANEFLYSSGSVVKRNLLVMPCDDGDHVPNFRLLKSGSSTQMSKYVNDMGVRDLSLISLDNLCTTASAVFGTSFETIRGGVVTSSNDFIDDQIGTSPENSKKDPGPAWSNHIRIITQSITNGTFAADDQEDGPYTIYQRTKDPSSNQIVLFDIDDLFYGMRIRPTTFSLTDADLSGSERHMSITLKDDGYGNIYRDDTTSKTGATWNSVGNIYYDEGLVLIKSPHLAFFGEQQFEVSFEGERNVHVMAIDVMAPAGTLNSSSNPSYDTYMSASGYANDPDGSFVYLTSLNLHDDNYNVVARAKLAQPIVKRSSDSLCVRVKIDF